MHRRPYHHRNVVSPIERSCCSGNTSHTSATVTAPDTTKLECVEIENTGPTHQLVSDITVSGSVSGYFEIKREGVVLCAAYCTAATKLVAHPFSIRLLSGEKLAIDVTPDSAGTFTATAFTTGPLS